MNRDELFSILGLAGHLPVLPNPTDYSGSGEDLIQILRKARIVAASIPDTVDKYITLLSQPTHGDLLGVEGHRFGLIEGP